jgi:hypothetical protein
MGSALSCPGQRASTAGAVLFGDQELKLDDEANGFDENQREVSKNEIEMGARFRRPSSPDECVARVRGVMANTSLLF